MDFTLYPYKLGEIVQLKKKHPCGSDRWEVIRVSQEIVLKCLGCQYQLRMNRTKLEKSTKRILEAE